MKRMLKPLLLAVLAGLSPFSAALSAQERAGTAVDSLLAEKVYLPVGREGSKYLTTGTARSWSGETIEKYPGVDIKNSFTGVIPGLFVTENTGATGVQFGASNVGLQVRGFSVGTYIVDDIVIPHASELPLNPEEIESVTVISDNSEWF